MDSFKFRGATDAERARDAAEICGIYLSPSFHPKVAQYADLMASLRMHQIFLSAIPFLEGITLNRVQKWMTANPLRRNVFKDNQDTY
jgi:hypothetical protein